MRQMRLFFFLIMIVAMTGFGCVGGSGGQADSLPIEVLATQAIEAAQSTPSQGSVTQTSNTDNGITIDRISSTSSYNQGSLQATVRNGATTLGPSDIVDDFFDLSRSVCQSCDTQPSGTSSQWQHVSLEKEDSDGTVYSIVFSDIEDNNDSDYLSAGIWMYVPEEADDSINLGEVVYGTFARGNAPFQANLQGLTGEARYEGDAMGLYTEQTSDTLEGGLFNATVELTANFGNASDMGTIRGQVTSFRARNEETNQPFSFQGTSLNLGETPIGNTQAGFFTGDTSGTHQGETYSGKWGGEFLGNGADLPTSVTGTFGSENSNGGNSKAFMGFFGAYQQ